MKYYVAIGSPKNHSGLECRIKCELQIGDYVQMWHEEIENKDEGELVVIKSRYYCAFQHLIIFFAERVS